MGPAVCLSRQQLWSVWPLAPGLVSTSVQVQGHREALPGGEGARPWRDGVPSSGLWCRQGGSARSGTATGGRWWCASTGCGGCARRATSAGSCTSTTPPGCPRATSTPSSVSAPPGLRPSTRRAAAGGTLPPPPPPKGGLASPRGQTGPAPALMPALSNALEKVALDPVLPLVPAPGPSQAQAHTAYPRGRGWNQRLSCSSPQSWLITPRPAVWNGAPSGPPLSPGVGAAVAGAGVSGTAGTRELPPRCSPFSQSHLDLELHHCPAFELSCDVQLLF